MLKIMLLALAFFGATPVFCGGQDENNLPGKEEGVKKNVEEAEQGENRKKREDEQLLTALSLRTVNHYAAVAQKYVGEKWDSFSKEYRFKEKAPWLVTGGIALGGYLVLRKAIMPFLGAMVAGAGSEIAIQVICKHIADKSGYKSDANSGYENWFKAHSGNTIRGATAGVVFGALCWLGGGGILVGTGAALGQVLGECLYDPYLKNVVSYHSNYLVSYVPLVKNWVAVPEGDVPPQYTLREAVPRVCERVLSAGFAAYLVMAVLKVK
jgi:hypothetical protein